MRTTPSWPRCAAAISAVPSYRLVTFFALPPSASATSSVATSSATAATVTMS